MPWIFGSYCCEVVHALRTPPQGDNLVRSTIDALVEPYPLAVAGTPERTAYDRATRTLSFTWDTARAGGGQFAEDAVTSFAVPASVYPEGASLSQAARSSRRAERGRRRSGRLRELRRSP